MKIGIRDTSTDNVYITPFEKGWNILELGGGENPSFHPNIDFRDLPTVDIVADLEKRLPVEDEIYDGVYSKMVIEHLGWRYHTHFASEMFRVLKPGGVAVIICPNTLEQCREIVRRGVIGVKENAMLFGGQEGSWGETGNYHKSAFSPTYIVELLIAGGFVKGLVKPVPFVYWDMIIEAYKAED